jgi:hypothetical protein
MRRIVIAFSLIGLMGCAATGATTAAAPEAVAPRSADTVMAELRRLEASKWDASLATDRAAFEALFAEDFESVEYGTDVQGGVHRRTRADVFSGPPLPPARFELSDWHFIHADTDVVVVSYKVTGLSFPWQAYATSVWSYRGGRWQTVFYQASTAKES